MVYIDNASTTFPKPECVYTAMDSFYRTNGVNASRGQYKAASITNKVIRDTRNKIKDLLKCNTDYEIVFSSTATEAINTVLQGLNYTNIKTIYVTPFEHNAVLRTLSFLQSSMKFDIIELELLREPLRYDIKKIEKQFNDKTPNLIVTTHASNVCGLITPIEEIALLAKKYNACIIVDMAQTAGLIETDLTAAGIDIAIFASHKTLYGSIGASGFIMKKNFCIAPLIYGGTGLDSANINMPLEAPERFEAGTRNIQAIAGLNESLKWIDDTGISAILRKEQELKNKLIERLSKYKNIRIIGQNDGIGIISCVFEGYAPDDIGNVLDYYEIAVRVGLHCAPNAHKYLGTFPSGTVRFSLGYFNSTNDIDVLDNALRYIQENG